MKLNTTQRRILWAGAAFLLVVMLFPPFHFAGENGMFRSHFLGPILVLTPPTDNASRYVVNVLLLALELAAIAIATGFAALATRE